MTQLYKLTDENMRTLGRCRWGEGVEHTASGKGNLCTKGWIHAYTSPLLAVFLDPIHGDIGDTALLWEAEGDVGKTDNGLKVGCTRLKTIRQIEKPLITTAQRIAFGILCALEISTDVDFQKWAKNWLSGKDRSRETAAMCAEAVGGVLGLEELLPEEIAVFVTALAVGSLGALVPGHNNIEATYMLANATAYKMRYSVAYAAAYTVAFVAGYVETLGKVAILDLQNLAVMAMKG